MPGHPRHPYTHDDGNNDSRKHTTKYGTKDIESDIGGGGRGIPGARKMPKLSQMDIDGIVGGGKEQGAPIPFSSEA